MGFMVFIVNIYIQMYQHLQMAICSLREMEMIVLLIVLVLVCLLLSALVLLQPGQGEGLAGSLGGYGSASPFGTKTPQQLARLTMYLGVAFFVLVIVIIVFSARFKAPGRVIAPKEKPATEAPVEVPGSGQPARGEAPADLPALPEGEPTHPPGE